MSVQFSPIHTLPSAAYVRVHLWRKASYNPKAFGHVAIEIKSNGLPDRTICYISFWPGNVCLEHKKENSHFHTVDDDDTEIHRPADKKYDLRNLNVANVYSAFLKFFNSGDFKWGVLGSSELRYKYERNCSGLALYLLEKGGINAFVTNKERRNYHQILYGNIFSLMLCMSVGVWSLSCYVSMRSSRKKIEDFWQDYRIVAESYNSAVPQIENIQRLISQLDNETVTKDTIAKDRLLLISTDVTKLKQNSELFRKFNSNAQRSASAKKYLFEAFIAMDVTLVGMLIPVAYSIYVIYLNNRYVLRAVTPSDVENLVKRAIKVKSVPVPYSNTRKARLWTTICIGTVLSSLFFVKFWKNSQLEEN